MSPQLPFARRTVLVVAAAALFASTSAAQRTAPKPPATYDAQVRYRIRAGTNQRIAQFQEMTRYLDSIGFQRQPSDDPNEPADPTAERFRGTLPSSKVRDLLREPHVRSVLLVPAGMTLPENPDERLLVQIELASHLSPRLQKDLADQARARLAGVQFVEKVGYDHLKYTRLLGTVPAGELDTLLRDLRDVPGGWLAPEVPRAELPEPIRDVNPIRVVEVLVVPADVPANADAPTPMVAEVDLAKLAPELQGQEGAEIARLEVILARAPRDGDSSWRDLVSRPGVVIEGRLGQIVAIQAPASVAKDLVLSPAVAGVRMARAATVQPVKPPVSSALDPVALSGLNRLHALGYRGKGVRVAVIGSKFGGIEALSGKQQPRTIILDLTAARNASIEPDPMAVGSEANRDTLAAQAVRLAAPECELVLIRVDSSAPYMLADVARYLHGNTLRPISLVSRNSELLADNVRLRVERRQVTEEQAAVANDFSQDEESIARRKKLAERSAALAVEERQYLERLSRFGQLEEELHNLKSVGVVVNALSWDIGYPADGTGPLSRYLDVSLSRAALASATWLQAAGDTRGQVWNGPLTDRDANGSFEFAADAMPLPVDRWSRELNFLGWQPVQGSDRVADLPAGTKLRVALQWSEAHDPDADALNGTDPYRTPIGDLRLLVLRQRDPSGSNVGTDDFNVVARSYRLPQLIERKATMATYESVIELTVEAAGRYALRIEGSVLASTRPAGSSPLGAQERFWEPKARVFVEAIGATNGRPVFADFPTMLGGLGTPGDAMTPRTIGAANANGEVRPYSATGTSAGRELLRKPTFVAFDGFGLAGGGIGVGTEFSTAFAGGLTASMLSAGIPSGTDLQWLGVPPGGLMVVPQAWLEQLATRNPAVRP